MFAEAIPGKPGVFPLLFVTIACGACSGFHALVASGTSSKQIDRESHILPVGYGSMLVEGVLAIIAIISVCYLPLNDFSALTAKLGKSVPPAGAFAAGLAHFAQTLHIPYNLGLTFISLAISAFMLTSLDTATRLCRFVWQELVLPPVPADDQETKAAQPQPGAADGKAACACPVRAILASRWISTLLVVVLAGWLALSGEGAAIWPVFGSSNQLLAALTLLSVTLWLMRTKRPVLFALLPMLFMLTISIWALVELIISRSGILVAVSVGLLVLALMLVVLGARKMLALRRQRNG